MMGVHDRERFVRRSRLARRTVLCVCLLGTALGASAAQAKLVKFPENRPKVSIDVPDDWSVTYTAIGLELRSPEKNSTVVADLFKNDKAGAQTWPQKARRVFEQAGVSFVEAPKPAASLPSTPTLGGEQFTFSGAPAVSMSGVIGQGAGPSLATAPPISTPVAGAELAGASRHNKIPHKIITYQDGLFEGKPTDLQLYIYSLTHDELFLIEQQSTGADARAIAIVYSVKAIH